MAWRLIEAFDFLQQDDLAKSSLFLFAKTNEGALGVTKAAATTGPNTPAD